MIKKTLYFGNPAYLSMRLNQLVIRNPDEKLSNPGTKPEEKTIPIEDIGVLILDNQQITITQALIQSLLNNNCALISCDSSHIPTGLMLTLSSNTIQSERTRSQVEASLPLKKQLWQQTVAQKIYNQAIVLSYSTGERHGNMFILADKVKSGDSDNIEGRAAVYYWKTVFPQFGGFVRGQFEDSPNDLLNYGYAILRAIVARALVAAGLLPTLGIHHHNRYDAYCLADDIMEPYRPYVDKLVVDILRDDPAAKVTQETKAKLLSIPTIEVNIAGQRSPLMIAAGTTAVSLVKCFEGELRKLVYPEMQ